MSLTARPSATSRVFLALLAGVVAVSVAVTALLVWDRRTAGYAAAERATHALAVVLATSSEVRAGLQDPAGPSAASALQARAMQIRRSADVSYITVMDADGTRYTHPSEEEIGARYRGTIPDTATTYNEVWEGTLGHSLRTIAPVLSDSDPARPIGWVSVGVTVETIWSQVEDQIPLVIMISGGFTAVGVCAALVGRRFTRRVAGDLSADALRNAASSYESLRTLGEALRAQTHEHGNRMHTAITLLELDRNEEAKQLLAETSRQSQTLVDLVTGSSSIDPTVSALILGKTAQASERGVELETRISDDAPRSELTATDLVSVIGNLLDNAVDAAALSRASPRSVRLDLRAGARDRLVIEVSDSGDGVPPGDRERVCSSGGTPRRAARRAASAAWASPWCTAS